MTWRRAAALSALLLTALALRGRRAAPARAPVLRAAAAGCVPDFGACAGGVLSPVRARCCNPRSSCFRRGRYFSQCRPRPAAAEASGGSPDGLVVSPARAGDGDEGAARAETARLPGTAAEALCAPDFGVCAAGADASSGLECCSKGSFHCRRSSPLFSQCLPDKHKRGGSREAAADASEAGDTASASGYAWRSVELQRPRMAYLSASQAAAAPRLIAAQPLSAEEKLAPVLDRLRADGRLQGTVVLRSTVPARIPDFPAGVDALLVDALPDGVVFRSRPGELLVEVDAFGEGAGTEAAVWDSAMVLASFPFVRDVRID